MIELPWDAESMIRGLLGVVAVSFLLAGCSSGYSQACIDAGDRSREAWDQVEALNGTLRSLEDAGAQGTAEYERQRAQGAALVRYAEGLMKESSRICEQ